MTRVVVMAWLWLASGCVSSKALTCEQGTANERICPFGNACDDVHHLCVSADQLTSCDGLVENADCTVAGAAGLCRDHVCLPVSCGDGIVQVSEKCDGDKLGSAT